MALSRPFALAGLLLLAVTSPALAQAPVDWYSDTGGGGVLAQPAGESENGGAVAPVAPEPLIEPPAQTPAPAPAPAPARAEASAQPAPGAREARPVAKPAAQPAAPVAVAAQSESGSLPFTGLELAGLFGAGLLLLVAGALLRPRRPASP